MSYSVIVVRLILDQGSSSKMINIKSVVRDEKAMLIPGLFTKDSILSDIRDSRRDSPDSNSNHEPHPFAAKAEICQSDQVVLTFKVSTCFGDVAERLR